MPASPTIVASCRRRCVERDVQEMLERAQLRGSAHQRTVEPPAVARRVAIHRRHSPCPDRCGLALHGELHRFGGNGVAHQARRGLRDQDLSGLGGLLQARRRVHDVAEHDLVARADDDLARAHPRSRRELDAPAPAQRFVEGAEPRSHLIGGAHRAQRIVFVGLRHAEHPDDGIADELAHLAAMRFDDVAHLVEVPVQHAAQHLGVESLAERRRADDVAEHGGDGLACLVLRSGRLQHVGIASTTAPGPAYRPRP